MTTDPTPEQIAIDIQRAWGIYNGLPSASSIRPILAAALKGADALQRQLAGYEDDWRAVYVAIGLSRDETDAHKIANRIRELVHAEAALAEAHAGLEAVQAVRFQAEAALASVRNDTLAEAKSAVSAAIFHSCPDQISAWIEREAMQVIDALKSTPLATSKPRNTADVTHSSGCVFCDLKIERRITPSGAVHDTHEGIIDCSLPVADCWCHKCHEGEIVDGVPYASTRMIVCPDCGNKRCPHANDHRNQCTHSNAAGQPGSAYP